MARIPWQHEKQKAVEACVEAGFDGLGRHPRRRTQLWARAAVGTPSWRLVATSACATTRPTPPIAAGGVGGISRPPVETRAPSFLRRWEHLLLHKHLQPPTCNATTHPCNHCMADKCGNFAVHGDSHRIAENHYDGTADRCNKYIVGNRFDGAVDGCCCNKETIQHTEQCKQRVLKVPLSTSKAKIFACLVHNQ